MGFQTQIWKPEYLPGGRRSQNFRQVGHTMDLVPVLTQKDETTAAWFFDALEWWWDATESWDDCVTAKPSARCWWPRSRTTAGHYRWKTA